MTASFSQPPKAECRTSGDPAIDYITSELERDLLATLVVLPQVRAVSFGANPG
jgi:hypothetical protein